MTYNVFGGTLNPTLLLFLIQHTMTISTVLIVSRDVKLDFFHIRYSFCNNRLMINVISPARWSCVTVDARHRLRACCTDSGPAATQSACRNCVSVSLATSDKDVS